MRRLDRIQLFVNRHYDGLKLLLLVVILVLSSILVLGQLSDSRRRAEERDQATEAVVRSIQRQTDHQTQIIKDQFQALCIVIINTSGPQALRQLDPATEQRCRDMLGGHIKTSQATSEPYKSSYQQVSQTKTQSPHQAAQTTPDKQSERANESDGQPPAQSSSHLTDLLNLIFGVTN